MSEPIWNKFLTDADREILNESGWASRAGFGKRPVVMVVDVSYAFTSDRPESVLDSIKRGLPMSCAEQAWKAIPPTKKLIAAGRAKGLPIIYTTGSTFRSDFWDVGAWAWKMGRLEEAMEDVPSERANLDGTAINDEIAPEPHDLLIKKPMPSAFFATALNSYLRKFEADSILMVGGTTSGCLRATVLDAFAECYRVTLVGEGCWDRFESSHAMSLFDMDAKYADVRGLDEVVEHIEGLPEGLFELPRGPRE